MSVVITHSLIYMIAAWPVGYLSDFDLKIPVMSPTLTLLVIHIVLDWRITISVARQAEGQSVSGSASHEMRDFITITPIVGKRRIEYKEG